MFLNIINWLESHTLPCLYKTFFGIECPGCGTQRALIDLLKGNIFESLKAWPALLPVMFMLVYLVLFLLFKFKNGLNILKIAFIINAAIITINYIYKLTLHLL
ncbi:MAG TPA: DUF2752 domain-containing protein [Bacteroidales bacterium]|nr:DUF2752 domain-containing protein [Bacteroidales bacterium]